MANDVTAPSIASAIYRVLSVGGGVGAGYGLGVGVGVGVGVGWII
ncbi:MAG: hypothetical protein QW650_05090 [Thermofilum sp.]